MILSKVMMKGSLDFGTSKSYEKAVNLFQHKAETLYKMCLLIKAEDIFNETNHSLVIPQLVINGSDKFWKNTIYILECMAQFAQAGHISAWRIRLEDNTLQNHIAIEPSGEKLVVQEYKLGVHDLKEGNIDDAYHHFSTAIEKYNGHSQAYERRGKVSFKRQNYEKAIHDYAKSIELNGFSPKPYFGRALAYAAIGELNLAVQDLEFAIKNSIPMQPIYWKSRRRKGEYHFLQQQYDKAAFELKFFTKRDFKEEDPNFKWKKRALIYYSKSLLELGETQEARNAWKTAIKISGSAPIDESIKKYLDIAFDSNLDTTVSKKINV